MNDLISRQTAIDALTKTSGIRGDALKALYDLPSVTPQPKMGRWVEEIINEWSRKIFCSKCGCAPPFEHISDGNVYSASGYGVINKTKFCPNCGAKMQKVEK